jgi:dolichyl-phosphate-mannose--protein O-mannosyl transferase
MKFNKTKLIYKKYHQYYFLFFTILITLTAGFLRFFHLGTIEKYIFDETYYVKDSIHLWKYGHEKGFVVHPPFGKWLIGIGIHLFNDPFGWRFMSALFGTLTIFLIILLIKRLFNNNVIALISGLFLAFDTVNISMSRVAMLDIFVCFFALLSVYLFTFKKNIIYILLTGIAIGLCISCKTIGVFLLLSFLILLLIKKKWKSSIILCISSVITYFLSWWGWFFTHKGYDRYSYINNIFNSRNFISKTLTALGSFFHYQKDMIVTAADITEKHSYGSAPYQWFFNIRPTQMYYAETNCSVGGKMIACVQDVVALNNPALYLLSIIAIIFLVILFIKHKNYKLLLILMPIIVFYIPWFAFFKRTMFEFYLTPLTPFIAATIPIAISYLKKKSIRIIFFCFVTILIICLSIYFYPVVSGLTISQNYWQKLMWFNNWI